MKKSEVLDLSFMAIYIALAVVLDYVSKIIPILQMPQGGNIALSVIPVLIASYHLGWKKALGVGLGWWLVGFLSGGNNWYLNPIQYFLDYVIPMSVIGLASSLFKMGPISNVYTGTVCTGIVRFLSTLLSGVYFWPPEGSVAGSAGAWSYSLGYNFYYNFATLVVALILVPLIINSLKGSKYTFEFIKK